MVLMATKGQYGLKLCYKPEKVLLDIVFVHGLTGHRERTWTHSNGVFWLESLLKNDIPEARITSFGYDADVTHFWSSASQNRVGNHASNLLNAISRLRERSETTDRPIIFVAHSLGGLVVEDAILASKNSAEPHLQQIRQHVVGIAFLGTPHCGSDMGRWAKVFGSIVDLVHKTNHNILETLKPESEVLARIQKEFHTMLRIQEQQPIKICCFYEELPVKGVGEIVPMHSAILPAYNAIGIHENHMDMTKFDGEDDTGYQAVSTELWRWAKTSIAVKQSADLLAVSKPESHNPRTPTTPAGHDGSTPTARPSSATNALDQPRPMSRDSGAYQGGVGRIYIENNHTDGKAVLGNNIHADGNVTLNF